MFTDDCFTSDVKRAIKILNSLCNNGLGYKYFFEARIVDLMDGELLSSIDPECVNAMQIGVDSGYAEGFEKILKGITLKQLYKTLDIIHKTRFTYKCFLSFIIGYPWETEKEINKTLDTIEFIAIKYGIACNINYHYMLPSTIWEKRSEYGIEINEDFFDNLFWHIDLCDFSKTHPLIFQENRERIKTRIEKMRKRGLPVVLQSAYI